LETTTHFTGGEIVARDFIFPFLTIGVISLLSLLPFRRLERNAGAEMSGHARQALPDPVTIMRERS
jgi:hypothetical protein